MLHLLSLKCQASPHLCLLEEHVNKRNINFLRFVTNIYFFFIFFCNDKTLYFTMHLRTAKICWWKILTIMDRKHPFSFYPLPLFVYICKLAVCGQMETQWIDCFFECVCMCMSVCVCLSVCNAWKNVPVLIGSEYRKFLKFGIWL